MLSLEAELLDARERGAIDARTSARLIAIERGELFPIGFEIRALAYVAVAMIVAGVGIVIHDNLDRIGPLALAIAIGIAAAGCYVPAIRTRMRGETRGGVGEYVLLLGALLVAADIGFIESQFHLLGAHWSLHLLFIAALHAVGAYYFESNLLLSASLAALTSWFGFEASLERMFDGSTSIGVAGLSAAMAIAIWRGVNARFPRFASFSGTFDFFIANVALLSSVMLTASSASRGIGIALAVAFAAASIAYGVRTRALSFVIYGVVYGVIASDIFIGSIDHSGALIFFWFLLSAGAGSVVIFGMQQSIRRKL
jgi:hypothetical protein